MHRTAAFTSSSHENRLPLVKIPKCNVEFGNLGKITGQHSRPQFHLSLLGSLTSYGRGGTWRRDWERLNHGWGWWVSGSHNKPKGCNASGAYAPGPDEEEEGYNTFSAVLPAESLKS